MPRLLAAVILAVSLAGCASVGYYFQAVGGQMEIWRREKPIDAVIADPQADPLLRRRLETVREVRAFAVDRLALPDNGSYREYADLGRPYVVWNVFATREFSVAPVEWCFPVAGCVAYRGYFGEKAAQDYAKALRADGYDVFVAGIPAYSTLGWFDDPVLNTFIHYPQAEVARLLFHELAHRVVYVAGDTSFNESFATTVELEGVARWLADRGTPAERAAFDVMQSRKRDFIGLVTRYRAKLETLYKSSADEASKRAGKAALFAAMRAEYAALRTAWGGFAGYDRFFSEDLNNAHLVPVASYAEWVPAFRTLLARSGGFPRFYAAVKEIGGLEAGARAQRLRALDAGDP
jgi:predicted aminopeptidase